MDPMYIGLRSQELHEGLKEYTSFGPKDVHFKKTLLVGKAAVLAMHLRGLLYIEDYTQLEYAAASLGITSLELEPVLRELEELDFVSVIRRADAIKRVDIRVPKFRSGYTELGQRWLALSPSEVEQASLFTLNDLYSGPEDKERVLQSLGLAPTQQAIMLDVMHSGSLITTQVVDGQPLLYTPLAVDSNPTAYLQWAQRFPEQVAAALAILRTSQGLPIDDPDIVSNPALSDAIQTGVLMPVAVAGATGRKDFVFAPHGGLTSEEYVILDKARAILSCVRYGQKFAQGRPIRYPRLILERLRSEKKFRKGHPDLFTQYGLLVQKLIGHLEDEGNGRWNFIVDDTDENIKALDVALEMLQYGESPSARINIEAQKALLSSTGYQGPIPTRIRLGRTMQTSPKTQAEIIKQMGNLVRGVSTSG